MEIDEKRLKPYVVSLEGFIHKIREGDNLAIYHLRRLLMHYMEIAEKPVIKIEWKTAKQAKDDREIEEREGLIAPFKK